MIERRECFKNVTSLVISSVLYVDIGDWESLSMIAVPRNTSGAWNDVILLVGCLCCKWVLYVVIETVFFNINSWSMS